MDVVEALTLANQVGTLPALIVLALVMYYELRLLRQELRSRIDTLRTELGGRIDRLEERVSRLGERVDALALGIKSFNEALLRVLYLRGALAEGEYEALRAALGAGLAAPRTKYYTWKDYEDLKRILAKGREEITWEDAVRAREIALKMMQEDDPYFRDYGSRLLVFVVLMEAELTRRGVKALG